MRAKLLEADLVGPFLPPTHPQAHEGEVLSLPPSRWYLTGFLAPQQARAPDPEDADSQLGGLTEENDAKAEDAGSDEPEAKRPVRFPASMGLSVFLPPGDGDSLQVDLSFADYDPVAREDDSRLGPLWRRVPHEVVGIEVPLVQARLSAGIAVPDTHGLRLKGELGSTNLPGLPPGTRVLSLFLVNERTPQEKHRDEAFIFQVRMTLHYAHGFLPRPNRRGETSEDWDQRVLALNFRNHFEWAVGHNTSVMAPQVPPGGRPTALTTTQLPTAEVKPVEHRSFGDVMLEMRALGSADGDALRRGLLPLVDHYRAWLSKQRSTTIDNPAFESTREQLAAEVQRTLKRLEEGIHCVAQAGDVREAFQLANQAMHVSALQRSPERYSAGGQPKWRPFQLAFVLINIACVADSTHPDRAVADLIYFPTGGGKTEAYLGLIAFTLLLRRMRGQARPDKGRGVAVILRYTLRLLTLDQLGRAATLICALEILRCKHPDRLGDASFTVGLWVGRASTANWLKDVQKILNDPQARQDDSPFPLSNCPWCSEEIKLKNIKLIDAAGKPSKTKPERVAVYCDNSECKFTEKARSGVGLPVLFCDEQIYREVPDFLVATVDKYAMAPWLGAAGMLFGKVTHLGASRAYGVMDTPPRDALPVPVGLKPPELVVQDELHLISGPLGTMVGLYESAIDYLCESRDGDAPPTKPKVVCSTATVRRAHQQIRALFGRDMAIFPPRGIDAGDNFFARTDDTKPGRLYVGVGAPGRALRAVSVRTYATLLAAAQKHFNSDGPSDQPADPYMTLIGYFNSLRELGGMRRLVEDEVRSRVHDFAKQKRPEGFKGPHPWAASRNLQLPAELTSRESTTRVKDTKNRLAAHRTSKKPEPLDVVLASNMISVGLDVDRLGLMVVTGQPKTSSEYIQSTSRVGRSHPGLVVTCLNVFRPRDRSHFERFVAYHESFYREVEATTVTPFSSQTLDRALVGTLLTMVRHSDTTMQPPAGFMELTSQRAQAESALEWLVERAKHHREHNDPTAEANLTQSIRRRGRHVFDAWQRIIQSACDGGATRIYSKFDRAGEKGKAVMIAPGQDAPEDYDEACFRAPTSMRDVEPTVPVWLRVNALDKRG